jgi:putative transposase
MPRQVRFQYPGAMYHVMARGNRGERIVRDDEDRDRFIETLGEACAKTGWRVHAWVLMDNHYHAVIETPRANLVAGMRWFQNTYTRRFNTRHRLWGHLYSGRYKAVPVEGREFGSGAYLINLIDYIHLNPLRAGLIDSGAPQNLTNYRWSSLASGYLVAQRKRPQWLTTEARLMLVGQKDSAKGRKNYLGHLEQLGHQHKGMPAMPVAESGQSTLKRGWYLGTERFKEFLLSRAYRQGVKRKRDFRGSEMGKDHAEAEAEELLRKGLKAQKLSKELVDRLPGSDKRKVAIAATILNETTVSQGWVAKHLQMKSAANVSQQLTRLRKLKKTTIQY